MTSAASVRLPSGTTVLAAGACLLIAANLRSPITALGPLVNDVGAATEVSASAIGLLTTLPLVAFAVISPFAPVAGRSLGLDRALRASMAVLITGLLLRSSGPIAAVFAGTLVIGAAIAVANVLLPALVKDQFAAHGGLMTGLYSATMAIGAGLATGLSVPLADGLRLGWRGALAFWAAPALLALVVARLAAAHRRPSARMPPQLGRRPHLRGSRLAWLVSGFMGLQSLLFYGLVAWLPAVLDAHGMSEADAGWMMALLQFVSIPTTLGVPIVAARMADQRPLVALAVAASVLGFAGFWTLGTTAAALWVVALGLGSGAMLSLALSFFLLRAPDARHTAALSSMAQSLGYLLAATGPSGLGLLYDLTDSWNPPMIALLLATLGALALGLGAARDAQIG